MIKIIYCLLLFSCYNNEIYIKRQPLDNICIKTTLKPMQIENKDIENEINQELLMVENILKSKCKK